MAAGQVAAIVTAAEQAANEIAANAEREARELERETEREVKKVRQDADAEIAQRKEEAQTEAVKIGELARKEAEERIANAQVAADRALEQAEAITAGLRQLGASLEGQAERILRDVQAGHRRLMADLRVEGAGRSRSGVLDDEPRPRSSGANPLDDIEPPRWVGREP
ncbi:MAG: hypothetical protein QOK25_2220 [Thermoleophilaceae bacterium]|jgi:hypothetical protein|nr:hypothetical protein [Thermoleophilaceae bacterium]